MTDPNAMAVSMLRQLDRDKADEIENNLMQILRDSKGDRSTVICVLVELLTIGIASENGEDTFISLLNAVGDEIDKHVQKLKLDQLDPRNMAKA